MNPVSEGNSMRDLESLMDKTQLRLDEAGKQQTPSRPVPQSLIQQQPPSTASTPLDKRFQFMNVNTQVNPGRFTGVPGLNIGGLSNVTGTGLPKNIHVLDTSMEQEQPRRPANQFLVYNANGAPVLMA